MCELLVLAAPSPFPLGPALQQAVGLEAAGEAGHGWGVAWLPALGSPLRLHKRPRALTGDPSAADLADEYAVLALIHLRMPTDMSTVGMPDTQPFQHETSDHAFAHNGYLARHDEWRDRYSAELLGRADSEVGFAVFRALHPELGTQGALRRMFEDLAGDGFANLVVLDRSGEATIYCANHTNHIYALSQHPGGTRQQGFTTSLHKTDAVLARAALAPIFPDAQLTQVPLGEIRTISVAPLDADVEGAA